MSALLCAVFLAGGNLFAADPRSLVFKPLKVEARAAERVVLSNGIVLYLVEDHELPTVSIAAYIRTGAIYEPAGLTGLAALTGTVMRTGGSARFKGDLIDEELELLAASVEFGIQDEEGTATLWSLKRHFPRVLEIFADIMMHPAFPEDKIGLAKAEAVEDIRRRFDEPGPTADIMFERLVYGPESPWARLSTEAGIKAVKRRDMIGFHRRFFKPGAVVMAVAGDFSKEDLAAAIEKALGGWGVAAGDVPAVAPVKEVSTGGVFLVSRNISQSNLRIGHLGIRIDNPDHFALKLMDRILGHGGFNDRLFTDIRSKRGLAYAVWSWVRPGLKDLGTISVGGETKSESTGEMVAAVLDHLERLRVEEVGDEELGLAKESYENSLAFEFRSSAQIARRSAYYEYHGLPVDWFMIERLGVLAQGKEDILRVARQHLRPDKAVILAVGDAESLRSQLSKFGEVKDLPLPGP